MTEEHRPTTPRLESDYLDISMSTCWPAGPGGSVEPDVRQVAPDDDIGHSVKDKLHVLGVRGACEVAVDLLEALSFIQVFKLTLDVSCRLLIRVPACGSESRLPFKTAQLVQVTGGNNRLESIVSQAQTEKIHRCKSNRNYRKIGRNIT